MVAGAIVIEDVAAAFVSECLLVFAVATLPECIVHSDSFSVGHRLRSINAGRSYPG